MLMSNNTCQLSSLQLPENGMNVESISKAFGSKMKLTPKKQFFLKSRQARLGKERRKALLPAVQSVCEQTQLVTTIDYEVNETQYEKYKRGEVILVPTPRSKRDCREVILSLPLCLLKSKCAVR